VASDGVDDYAIGSFAHLGAQETFGLAFTIQTGDSDGNISNFTDFDASNATSIDTRNSPARVQLRAGDTDIITGSTTNIEDNNVHLCVCNKTGDDAANIKWWIDDMDDAAAEQNIRTNENGFDSSNYAGASNDVPIFAREFNGFDNFRDMDIGLWEINSDGYSEQERKDIKTRRPEL
jgi:hypothetical protein